MHSIGQSNRLDAVCWRPSSRATKEVKISAHSDLEYDYGTELFNFTEGVKATHVYLALVERVEQWTTTVYGIATPRIPKREVKIMR